MVKLIDAPDDDGCDDSADVYICNCLLGQSSSPRCFPTYSAGYDDIQCFRTTELDGSSQCIPNRLEQSNNLGYGLSIFQCCLGSCAIGNGYVSRPWLHEPTGFLGNHQCPYSFCFTSVSSLSLARFSFILFGEEFPNSKGQRSYQRPLMFPLPFSFG